MRAVNNIDDLFDAIKTEADFQGFRNLCKNNSKILVELADENWAKFVAETKTTYGIGSKRNLAKIEFEGQEKLIASNSGYNGQMTTSGKFIPESVIIDIENGNRIFEPTIPTRRLDTESIGLEYFAKQKGAVKGSVYPEIKGTLKLTSDLCPCPSCSAIFQQFGNMFPNINIEITTTIKLHY